MNAAKVTLTSTILAAALALALAVALGATPAAAHHRDGHAGGPGGEEPATIFDVILEFLVVTDTGSSAMLCSGTTDILANPGLSVDFDGCTVDMSVNIPGDPVFAMSLFRLEVKTKGSGVREAVLNFRDDEFTAPNSNLWITDRLPALKVDCIEGEDCEFKLKVGDPLGLVGEFLTKGHQPHKGAATIKRLLIGNFKYTPIEDGG